MSDGFPWAKVDSSFPADPKVRRLERMLPYRDYLAAVGAWLIILADSWRAGSREGGIAASDLLLDDDLVDALQGVHLLDADGRIPASSWRKWTGAAVEEREKRNAVRAEIARLGGKARASSALRGDRARFQPSPAVVQPSAGPPLEIVQPSSSRSPAVLQPSPAKSESERESETVSSRGGEGGPGRGGGPRSLAELVGNLPWRDET